MFENAEFLIEGTASVHEVLHHADFLATFCRDKPHAMLSKSLKQSDFLATLQTK